MNWLYILLYIHTHTYFFSYIGQMCALIFFMKTCTRDQVTINFQSLTLASKSWFSCCLFQHPLPLITIVPWKHYLNSHSWVNCYYGKVPGERLRCVREDKDNSVYEGIIISGCYMPKGKACETTRSKFRFRHLHISKCLASEAAFRFKHASKRAHSFQSLLG